MRAIRAGQSRSVVEFTAHNFPSLASDLGLHADGPQEALADRVLLLIKAFDREHGSDWRYDEFRALIRAGFAWWGVPEPCPSRQQWQDYLRIVNLRSDRDAVVDVSRRSFRHTWSGYAYRLRRSGDSGPSAVETGIDAAFRSSDYDNGKRQLGKRSQEALIAFLRSFVENGDGHDYWDPVRNIPRAPRLYQQGPTLHQEDSNSAATTPDLSVVPVEDEADETPTPESDLARSVVAYLDEASRWLEALGLRPVRTVRQVGKRLLLLREILHALDYFQPSVFERPLDELILAYQPRNPDLPYTPSDRRSARRRAKALLRTGVTVPNMEAALSNADRLRREWRRVSYPATLPSIPVGLHDALLRWDEWNKKLYNIGDRFDTGYLNGMGAKLLVPILDEYAAWRTS